MPALLKRLILTLTATLAALIPVVSCDAQQPPAVGGSSQPAYPGKALFMQYCATCHGSSMKGGTASNLTDAEWKHGSTREEIHRSIHDGIPRLGMPAYGEVLDDAQIELIVDAILGVEKPSETVAPPQPETRTAFTSTTWDYEVKADVWVEGLDNPWSIDFIDRRRALITEKSGRLRLVENGILHPDPIAGTPQVVDEGQAGLLDVAIDPEYASNGWIYLSYSHGKGGGRRMPAMTRLVRGRILDHRWAEEQVLFEAPEASYSDGGVHFGCRIVFDREGRLYFCIGERGRQNLAQRLETPNGKVFRIERDGSVPADNPFLSVEGALPQIYSYGHRNPQGLAFHPVTGDLWEAEHGPRGGDELNIVKPGANYGWPVITYGINYNGTIITRDRVRDGMQQPAWVWRPSIAVCGIDFYRGGEFPTWQNHLLVSSLANETLRLLHIEEGRVIHEEVIVQGHGRLRDVVTGPDGAIYVAVNGPHHILRLTNGGETKH